MTMDKNPTPFFSIITVTYNAVAVLQPTLQSVRGQSCKDYEYIVVDGASHDGTLELVRRSGLPVRLISECDNGIYDAMNKGMKIARGQYLVFLNAGDAFHTADTLQEVRRQVGEQRPGVIYGETAIVDENRRFVMMRRLRAPEHLTWRSFANGMMVCHQAFMARRDLAPRYDLQYRYSADVDWCIRCMKKSDELYNTHLVLIDYLREGTTTRNRAASLRERFAIMCRYYGTLPTIFRHLGFALRFAMAKLRGRE